MYLKKAITFTTEFFKTLRQSRLSSKKSLDFVKAIDSGIVYAYMLNIFFRTFRLIGITAIVGVLMQKFADGWIKPEYLKVWHVWTGAGIFLVVGIIWIIIWELMGKRTAVFEDEKDRRLEDMAVQKIMSLDVGRLTDPEFVSTRDLAERHGTWAFEKLWETRIDVWGSVVGIIGSFALVAALDIRIIGVMLVPFIPVIVKNILVDKKRIELRKKQVVPTRVKSEFAWCLTDSKMSVQSKLFNFQDHFWKRFKQTQEKLADERLQMHKFEQRADTVIGILGKASTACVLLYLGYQTIGGAYDLAKLYVLYGSLQTFTTRCGMLSTELTELSSQHGEYLHLEQFMDAEPMLKEDGCVRWEFDAVPVITLNNVWLTYPGMKEPILKGCTFIIPARSKVALVGRNGCGKTTTLRALAKVYDLEQGEVTYDETCVADMLQSNLLEQIMFVTQNTTLPDFALDEAITGTSRDKIDYERLRQASVIVGVDEMIEKLPHGFATQIGVDWPGGVAFSDGQLQRLKLVAAFYRLLDSSVRVGLFDEPMSNCDIETREKFYAALSLLIFKDKTIVVAAHDPMYLYRFERVVVMKDGCVFQELTERDEIKRYQTELALDLSEDLS